MRTSIKKVYSDLPFAHRQHKHAGHCALIHGHNWTVELTMECDLRDAVGFIYDFGKMKTVKTWLEDRLDHTLLLNVDDPLVHHFQHVLGEEVIGGDMDLRIEPEHRPATAKIIVVADCSCEGIAEWLLTALNNAAKTESLFVDTARRAFRITQVTVWEDHKNCATAHLT